MTEHSRILAEGLLAPRRAHCSGNARVFLGCLIGLGVAVSLCSLTVQGSFGVGHFLAAQASSDSLAALHLQPPRTRLGQSVQPRAVKPFVVAASNGIPAVGTSIAASDEAALTPRQRDMETQGEAYMTRRQAALGATLTGFLNAALALAPIPEAGAAPKAAKKPFKGKPGPDGIQYRDLVVGEDTTVTSGSQIKLSYDLRLESGNLVEQEVGAKFIIGGACPPKKPDEYPGDKKGSMRGWELAFLGGGDMPPMKAGGLREVLIPAEIAYGKQGVNCNLSANCPGGFAIPPNTAIKFTLELQSVRAVKPGESSVPGNGVLMTIPIR